ncbi:limbin [Gastrophryne carolinensis]
MEECHCQQDYMLLVLQSGQWRVGEDAASKELYLEPQLIFGKESGRFVTSSTAGNPWAHSVFAIMPKWMNRIFFRREVPQFQTRAVPSSSSGGVTFQKCGSLSNGGNLQTASISLLTNNPAASSSVINLTNLHFSDNITGLLVQGISYNSSSSTATVQIFKKESLGAGNSLLISYTVSLNTTDARNGLRYSLPAVLTFQNSSEVSGETFSIVAPFTVTAKEISDVIPNHGLHFSGFIIAFVLSFLLSCGIFLLLYHFKKLKPRYAKKPNQISDKLKQEISSKTVDGVADDLSVTDRFIDIIAFEEPEQMLQVLEDLEIANLTQADANLEVCRLQICKDVTGIFLRNMTEAGTLSPLEEKNLRTVMSSHWSDLQKRLHEEHQRKMVALTAECNLETRKLMESQHRWQKEASEEAYGIMKHTGEKSITEQRTLLDKLHSLEQSEMKRMLLFKQEEMFAKAYRQLAITHRTDGHKIFFDQVQSSMKGKPEVLRALIENYLQVQEEAEDLIDLLQATKKCHMNKRLAVRKNLLYNIQLGDSRSRCHLNAAATQIENLINRTQRAGHISESQAELLLESAQSEVLKVKQKLENALKQERRKLHHRLNTKRNAQVSQRLKDHKKELSSMQELYRNSKEVLSYLENWKKVFTNHCRELEKLHEKHDKDAIDEFKEIKYSLTEKAIEDLRHVQSNVIIPDMVKLNVPRLHLQQVLDEHKRESALLAQQLEKEENDKAGELGLSLESAVRKLDEEFKLNLKEQKNLRQWEHILFLKILLLPLCVSEEDVHKIKQEFQCGFSQMDITLALPKIQGRALLQKYQNDWRNTEIQKIEHKLLEAKGQSGSKTTKHPQDSVAEILKKSAEDKILIYEAQIADDKIKQVRGELLLQRVHQLKTREYKLGEFMTSLQFQIVNNKSKTLASYSALLQLQSLLLEEEQFPTAHNIPEYDQLPQTLNQEIKEMENSLETWKQTESLVNKVHKEDTVYVTVDMSCEEESLPLSAMLRKALNRRKSLTNLYRDRMQREAMEYALAEDKEEKAQMCKIQRLYNQDIQLAADLSKRSPVPEAMLRRVLSLLLPMSSESEISFLFHSLGHKYSERVIEADSIGDGADSWKKRKHQELWMAVEKRLREGLTDPQEEKNILSSRKKRSILKKKKLRPVKRVSFSHPNCLANLLQTAVCFEQLGSAEASNIPDIEEKLYVFRAHGDSPSPQSRPKKKRSFLNSKKA